MERLKIWFESYYDKWIALLAILGLLFSLVYILYRAGTLPADQDRFNAEQKSLTPQFPTAAPPDTLVFEEAQERRTGPFQLPDWTNKLMTPELRVICIQCERPIPFTATNCPFLTCQAAQPPDVIVTDDRDGDGMPDAWEKKYNLNPLDPTDAVGDLDNDGFTNVEEHRAATDPTHPKEHPAYLTKLRVLEFRPIDFKLVFKAVSKMTDGEMFQLNLRDNERTLFLRLGENTDKAHPSEGFKLVDFKREPDPRTPDNRYRDQEILTLQKGDKLIRLIKGQKTPWNEFEISLLFALENREIKVRAGSEFELRGVKYRVKEIDSKAQRVLIESPTTPQEKEVWVEKAAR
jgi:hypothetical protein